jgi:hypothetical protein
MHVALSYDETAALIHELQDIAENDPYPSVRRASAPLRAILNKLRRSQSAS